MNGRNFPGFVPFRLSDGQDAVFMTLAIQDPVKVRTLATLTGEGLNELAGRIPVPRVLVGENELYSGHDLTLGISVDEVHALGPLSQAGTHRQPEGPGRAYLASGKGKAVRHTILGQTSYSLARSGPLARPPHDTNALPACEYSPQPFTNHLPPWCRYFEYFDP